MSNRETDAKVAKALGWKLANGEFGNLYAYRGHIDDAFVFNPSTNISAAIEALNQYANFGYSIYRILNEDLSFSFTVGVFMADGEPVNTSGSELPETICSAILAASEKDERGMDE